MRTSATVATIPNNAETINLWVFLSDKGTQVILIDAVIYKPMYFCTKVILSVIVKDQLRTTIIKCVIASQNVCGLYGLQEGAGSRLNGVTDLTWATTVLYFQQTHHMQCPAEPRMYPNIDCNVFNHPKPMTMALSVLVTIEMLNALNR